MSQRKGTGLNTNPWPKLVDHYNNGKNYYKGESVPESCPLCGEHKEFSLAFLESLEINWL